METLSKDNVFHDKPARWQKFPMEKKGEGEKGYSIMDFHRDRTYHAYFTAYTPTIYLKFNHDYSLI